MWLGDLLNRTKQLVTLSSSRKEVLRLRVLERIQSGELPTYEEALAHPMWFTSFFAMHRVATSAIAGLLVVAVLGFGTSYAAEGSLPGDTLYPVKVHVNERVYAAVKRNPTDRALLAEELAARRLDEAAELATLRKLDDDTQAALENDFDKQVTGISEQIRLLERSGRNEDARETAERFTKTMRARTEKLQKLSDDFTSDRTKDDDRDKHSGRGNFEKLQQRIDTRLKEISKKRDEEGSDSFHSSNDRQEDGSEKERDSE